MGYGSDKVMSRKDTLKYLHDKYINGERLIVNRFNDGEYLLMQGIETNQIKRQIGSGSSLILKNLLINSMKNKKQLVCTGYMEPSTLLSDHYLWYKTQKFVIDNSNHDLYGCSNWATADFRAGNILIPFLFSDKTLIVSGIAEHIEPVLIQYNKQTTFYKTPNLNAEKHYFDIKRDLINSCGKYKNIILACGPLSKVLLVDLIDECDAHLIDVGSLINAICHKEQMWTMTWASQIPLKEYINRFLEKVKHELV
jgi:hypothetical protein